MTKAALTDDQINNKTSMTAFLGSFHVKQRVHSKWAKMNIEKLHKIKIKKPSINALLRL